MGWTHDVIVIGAGSAGLTAAGGCARLGLRVALVERDRMGGECLYTGCVPSKALLAAAHRAAGMRGDRLGVRGGAPVVDYAAVRAHVAGAIAAIAPHDSEERFAGWGVEVVRGEAVFTGPRSVAVGARVLRAKRVVVATGSVPAVPDVPGLEGVPFLTNETLFGLETLPAHLVVLGGGPAGVEMAQAFRRLGSAVTMVTRGAMLAREEPAAVAVLRERLVAEGVVVREGARVVRADGGLGVRLVLEDGVVEGSHLLVAAGRRARVAGLGLAAAGVAVGPDGIVVDARRRTSNRAVFAIGDCRAGPRFTHAAGHEGTLVVSALGFGLASPARFGALPAVTYTAPEVARVGLTEREARAAHRGVTVRTVPFSENDRAVAEGDAAGFVQVVRAGRTVLGVTIVGAGAGELLLPWSLVMRRSVGLWALSGVIAAYPTRSELSKAAAFAGFEAVLFGRAARGWAWVLARVRR